MISCLSGFVSWSAFALADRHHVVVTRISNRSMGRGALAPLPCSCWRSSPPWSSR